jgi:hypothetical protein
MTSPEQVIADALDGYVSAELTRELAAESVAGDLRAAGLLPGPDDIVVSREALTTYLLSSDPHELEIANQILCAALSQPHPAQEQTVSATVWHCSSRCWAEGGPHDDECHETGTYETEIVVMDDGHPSIVVTDRREPPAQEQQI